MISAQCSYRQARYKQSEYSQIRLEHHKKPISTYTFGIDDLIEIKFFDYSQFSETVRVRPDGRISLSKVDEVFVLGMTPSRLDSIVTAAYSHIIQQPDVTIIVREFGARHVYVLGEVNQPGGYPLQRNMTLLHSIAAAGGFKKSAELKSLMLLRRDSFETISAFKIDATWPSKKNIFTASIKNPNVYSMDIIYVPETYIASASDFLNQLYDIILPPFDVYLRALWYSYLIR